VTDLGTSLTPLLSAAPELQSNPSLALSLASTGSPAANAQAVQGAVNATALNTAYSTITPLFGSTTGTNQAAANATPNPAFTPLQPPATPGVAPVNTSHHSGLLSSLGHLGSEALKTLNKPLQYVQHEYRYLHDVEANHGPIAAVAEGLGIAAGAAGGFALGGFTGAALGAEAVAGVEGQFAFHDSWQRTANGNTYRDPHTGDVVSLGRDISDLLGIKPKEGPGIHLGWDNLLSATIDGAFDIVMDPLQLAGRTYAGAVSATGTQGIQEGGLVSRTALGGQGFTSALGRVFSGTGAWAPTDVDRVLSQYPSVRRAFADIAASNAGDIVARYGNAIAPAARALGQATTVDQVASVFRDALEFRELAVPMPTLPRLALTREAFRTATEAAQEVLPSGLLRRLPLVSPKLPVGFDELTQSFSGKAFSLTDDYGAEGIYRNLMAGEKESVARAVANEYLNTTDPGKRLGIFRNALAQMVVTYSKIDPESVLADPEAQRELMSSIDDAIGYRGQGSEAVYGIDPEGNNLSKVPSEDGKGTVSAGITLNQTGKMRFLSMDDLKQISAELQGQKNMYGQADKWVYEHAISRWKSLVTATGGFAARLSLSEMIPNSLRQGVMANLSNIVKTTAAKLAVQGTDDPEQMGMIGGLVWRMIGSPTVADEAAPEDLSMAVKLALRHSGSTIPDAVDASHALPATVNLEVEKRLAAIRSMGLSIPPHMRLGDAFGMLSPDDENAVWHWTAWLRELGNDPMSQAAAGAYRDAIANGAPERIATENGAQAAQDVLRSIQERQPRLFNSMYRATHSTDPSIDPVYDWARTVMANVKGATTSADSGLPHIPLLSKIAEGEAVPNEFNAAGMQMRTSSITQADVKDIPQLDRPALIKGREFVPDTRSTVDRIANFSHQRVIAPIINFFVRQPSYLTEVEAQYAPYKALVAEGVMNDETAMDLAETKAVLKMSKFIHNPLEKTQFSEMMRNWVPFYFAQEQAYRRFGRLLADNPGAFRQYQLIISTMHDLVTQVNDGQGNSWALYPGTGMLTQGALQLANTLGLKTVAAVPVAFAGSTSSLSTVFPFAEGVRPENGPLVAIPVHLLDSIDPHLQPVFQKLVGDQTANTALWEQLIPNTTVRDLVIATPVGEQTRGFQSAMMQTLQNLSYQQDKAMAQWRTTQQYKNFIAQGGDENDPNAPGRPNLLPSPEALAADPRTAQKLLDKVRNQTRILYIMKGIFTNLSPTSPQIEVGNLGLPQELQADITKTGDVSAGITQFLQKNPDATPFTVFQSQTTGADVPESQQAMDWVDSHNGFVNANPLIASFFLPQETNPKYSPAVGAEQVALGLRTHKTPQQFLDDLYIAAGNHQYFDIDLPSHEAALATTGDKTAEYNNWDAYVQQMEKTNPIWGNWFTSGDRKQQALQVIQDIGRASEAGQLPAGPQTNGIIGLMNDYLAHLSNMPPGSTNNSYLTAQARTENDNFDAYLKTTAKAQPNLAPFINKVLRQVLY